MTAPTEPTAEALSKARPIHCAIEPYFDHGVYEGLIAPCPDCKIIALALDAFRREGVERTKQAILPSLFVEEIQARERRIASLEAELARAREELDKERACHDCEEYRAMLRRA